MWQAPGESTRKRIAELRAKLRRIGSAAGVVGKAAAEYDRIQTEIQREQDRCSHYYERFTAFTSVRTICRYCDREEGR